MSGRHKKLSKKWYEKAITIQHHPINNNNFEYFEGYDKYITPLKMRDETLVINLTILLNF